MTKLIKQYQVDGLAPLGSKQVPWSANQFWFVFRKLDHLALVSMSLEILIITLNRHHFTKQRMNELIPWPINRKTRLLIPLALFALFE